MEDLKKELAEIELKMQASDFWQDKDAAQQVIRRYDEVKAELSGQGKYDGGNAVMTVFAGAGGDDSEDFVRMLSEMYVAFIEKNNWQIAPLHTHANDHGGYKNISFEIQGKGVYGLLKNESGVHRLVRISPFNSKKQRHTSFAMVEVIPQFNTLSELEIPDEDIRVEFSKSGGPGGQNVNKRETAVRVIHLPTEVAVHVDSERTQGQNRDKAIQLLQGKLYRLLEEQQRKEEKSMQISQTTQAEWGSQIRSYVLHPYKMVKDHRSEVEERDVEKVLAGDIEPFLEPYKTI